MANLVMEVDAPLSISHSCNFNSRSVSNNNSTGNDGTYGQLLGCILSVLPRG